MLQRAGCGSSPAFHCKISTTPAPEGKPGARPPTFPSALRCALTSSPALRPRGGRAAAPSSSSSSRHRALLRTRRAGQGTEHLAAPRQGTTLPHARGRNRWAPLVWKVLVAAGLSCDLQSCLSRSASEAEGKHPCDQGAESMTMTTARSRGPRRKPGSQEGESNEAR